MNIFKAIKREKKQLKHFYISMILIAVILFVVVFLTELTTPFYLSYLIFIEFLIFIAIINKINYHKLTYICNNNRLRCKNGLFSKDSLIFCDKVVLVHTEKMEDEMEIILVTIVNLKNKVLKPVGKGFLKRYPLLTEDYFRLKKQYPDTIFYYNIIKKGGLKKYILLDEIYKNCVKAVYTDEAIENIKIARGQTLV